MNGRKSSTLEALDLGGYIYIYISVAILAQVLDNLSLRRKVRENGLKWLYRHLGSEQLAQWLGHLTQKVD